MLPPRVLDRVGIGCSARGRSAEGLIDVLGLDRAAVIDQGNRRPERVEELRAPPVGIVAEEHRKRLMTTNGVGPNTFLIDGFIAGTWRIVRTKATATLRLDPFQPLAAADRDELAEEGTRLLAFAAPDVGTHDIQFMVPE